MVDEGLDAARRTKHVSYVAELLRLKGELLERSRKRASKKDATKGAEAAFQQAIQIARGQKAKSLELRAAISLCRLWQKTGKTKEAKATLAKIYGWFTEGFDSPDLKAAKELLDQLS
jgi:predicted ATPase